MTLLFEIKLPGLEQIRAELPLWCHQITIITATSILHQNPVVVGPSKDATKPVKLKLAEVTVMKSMLLDCALVLKNIL